MPGEQSGRGIAGSLLQWPFKGVTALVSQLYLVTAKVPFHSQVLNLLSRDKYREGEGSVEAQV